MDEMQARAEEMGYFYNRPKMQIDKAGMDISIEAGKQKIKGIRSSLPWANANSIAKGGFDMMNIFDKARWFE